MQVILAIQEKSACGILLPAPGRRETPKGGGHRISRQAIVRNAHLMSYKRHFCLSRAGGKNESGGNPAG
jgi:hypothetical protein